MVIHTRLVWQKSDDFAELFFGETEMRQHETSQIVGFEPNRDL